MLPLVVTIWSIFLGVCFPSVAWSMETALVGITLNAEQKGEYVVKMTDEGDFLVEEKDLKSMGVAYPKGEPKEVDGKRYMSVKSIEGVSFAYDESNVSLDLQASPDLLPKQIIDFTPLRESNIHRPENNSAFLNYGLSYGEADSFKHQFMDATTELGVRLGGFLLLSDSVYTRIDQEDRFTRLMTTMIHDDRTRLTRFAMGDMCSSSGDLGSRLNMGGLSYSKNYSLDPYLTKQPMFAYTGYAMVPSQVDVYLDGNLIKSTKVAPGGFDLSNITGYGGANNLNVVVRDAFGREEQISSSFYSTDALLEKGLHEFNYSAGFLREDFGHESNGYGDLAFTAFHRYGLTDRATVGFRGEGTKDLYNFGPQGSYNLGGWGVVDTGLSMSAGQADRQGFAGSLGYAYAGKGVNTRMEFNAFTRDYTTIGDRYCQAEIKYEGSMGIGYGSESLGSLSLSYSRMSKYDGDNGQAISLSYFRGLTKDISLSLSFRHTEDREKNNAVCLGITYYPWKDTRFSSMYYRGDKHAQSGSVQLQKDPPRGEGFGYRASVATQLSHGDAAYTVSPHVQYNGPYGIYAADYGATLEGTSVAEDGFRISASGAIATVGKAIGFTRPINDSFALVEVDHLPGIKVSMDNQEIGRTDSSGRLFLPDLGSYRLDRISIEDKDVPVDYALNKVTSYVSPPFRSGSLIKFEAEKIQAFVGALTIDANGSAKPLEFQEVKMTVNGKDESFLTGRDGQFYLENIPPGAYTALLDYQGASRSFTIVIPKSDEMIVEIGGITIED